MRAEIISVGSELLLGQIVNTNAAYLSRKLAELGIDLHYQATIGDNPLRLTWAIDEALSRSDLVITIGGLGPTVDDITLYAISGVTFRALKFNKAIQTCINDYLRKRGVKKIPKDNEKQAYIPRGARWFKNKVGTAPAICMEHKNKIIIALPGPPRELMPLFENSVIPYLKKKKFAGSYTIKTKTIKTAGLAEAHVNEHLKDLLAMGPKTTVGIYAHLGEVSLKITTKARTSRRADEAIKKVEKKILKRLGNFVYGTGSDTLESAVGKILTKRKATLSIAESCTGGLIADRITNVSGSSKYFKAGVVAYSNKAKMSMLGVPESLLDKYGAVSKEIALNMAEGIKNLSKSSVAVGVTGIAGPAGGTRKKPVGLVYIAVVNSNLKIVKKCLFTGKREEIKHQAANMALNLIRPACEHS